MEKIDLDHFESVFIQQSLTDDEYFSKVCELTNPIYIQNKHRRNIFEIVKDFFERRNTIPTLIELKNYLTTKDLKESFKFVLLELQTIGNTHFNKEELYNNTERFLKERAIYHTMMDVADTFSSGNIDTSDILEKFEKNCNISLKTNDGIEIFSDVQKIVNDLNRAEPVISTKWKWLDDKLDGGFSQNGRALYIFVGQTNVGKSIVLGNIAKNIAEQNKTVLLISLEMSELMYAKRLSSSITKIPMRNLKSESVTMKTMMDEVHSKTPKGKILIKEFPPSTISVKQLEIYIKSIQSRGTKIDAIVLDYINLLTTSYGNNSYEKIKYITEQVRALSYLFNCPIISASQIGRSGYNIAEPDMTTISECIEVNQLVTLRDGTVKKIGDIQFGEQVTSNDGYKTVTQVHHKKTKKCYRIKLKSGKCIIVSEEHKFPTNRGRKSIVGGIRIGDRLNSVVCKRKSIIRVMVSKISNLFSIGGGKN